MAKRTFPGESADSERALVWRESKFRLTREALAANASSGYAAAMRSIEYSSEVRPDVDSFTGLLRRSTLGERRPIQDSATMRAMIEGADVFITAWDGETLVGVARTLTDFRYVAYLADLAVDQAYQRKGIGRELIRRTQSELEPTCFITLLAAPKANEYYGRLGFLNNPRAWMLPAGAPVL